MAKVNWIAIRTEYEIANISQRKLAEKYGVSYPTLRDRCSREEWVKSKDKTRSKIVAKTLQKTVTKIAAREADRNVRHIALLDKILDKIEKVVDEELNAATTMFGKVIKTELIQTDKLDTAMKVLEKVQKGHRLALGLDKKEEDKSQGGQIIVVHNIPRPPKE